MVTEEVTDGIFALGKACMWMREKDGILYCYKRAKDGFVLLLREDHAKSVEVTYSLLYQTMSCDERIAELTALWEGVEEEGAWGGAQAHPRFAEQHGSHP